MTNLTFGSLCGIFSYSFSPAKIVGKNRWLCGMKKDRSLKTKDNLASFRHFFYVRALLVAADG
jgi:hypothetical protein